MALETYLLLGTYLIKVIYCPEPCMSLVEIQLLWSPSDYFLLKPLWGWWVACILNTPSMSPLLPQCQAIGVQNPRSEELISFLGCVSV